jgi:hypothetical protein
MNISNFFLTRQYLLAWFITKNNDYNQSLKTSADIETRSVANFSKASATRFAYLHDMLDRCICNRRVFEIF